MGPLGFIISGFIAGQNDDSCKVTHPMSNQRTIYENKPHIQCAAVQFGLGYGGKFSQFYGRNVGTTPKILFRMCLDLLKSGIFGGG